MNEAETRAELIDPQLSASGWGVIDGSKVLREHSITKGRIQAGGTRAKPLKADYILVYKGQKLAAIEAKSIMLDIGEGVAQAKDYATKLELKTTFSANGKEIYQICMKTGKEGAVARFPTPDELWARTFEEQNVWRDRFSAVPFEDIGGTKTPYYYQINAIEKVLDAVSKQQNRILLTLATGTGKTFIAFQIAWKLFHTRWTVKQDRLNRPRILFLADRNILTDQAYNSFSAFPPDALVRIKPEEIAKKGCVPTNASIFFTIFQTFTSGKDNKPYYGDYPTDFFDFIIVDECHRGGANDESTWRGILEYFSSAVQLGLTATPKRSDNVDTYRYFGDPVYIYSLKEGINDGFLTPFKVKRIQTTLDDYVYTPDDDIIDGEVEAGKRYVEEDFNKNIEIKAREKKRVKILLDQIDQTEKTLVFCRNQYHAALIRDLINQNKQNQNPDYCVRVTANDGQLGEDFLKKFQDNENTIPTILTTSQKLSTGVDARNVRNIALLRPINSMIEFKQIIGRGTRMFDGKDFFTIYDFVDASKNFSDPEWDGDPINTVVEKEESLVFEKQQVAQALSIQKEDSELSEEGQNKKVKIKLRDGKEREIQHMTSTYFWDANGTPISSEEYLKQLYGHLPDLFKNEHELRTLWSTPTTRKALLDKLSEAGFGMGELKNFQKLIHAENSDVFDVLAYVQFALVPVSREIRVDHARSHIFSKLTDQQKEFVEFVLSKYIDSGVEELAQDKLPVLLDLKYQSITDAESELGDLEEIAFLFGDCQKYLYQLSA